MIKIEIQELKELLKLSPSQIRLLELTEQKQISEREYRKSLKDNPIIGVFCGQKIKEKQMNAMIDVIDSFEFKFPEEKPEV